VIRIQFLALLSLLLRLIVIALPSVAFGMSSIGKWIGFKFPATPVPEEYIGVAIAVVAMGFLTIAKRKSGPFNRSFSPAALGMAFQVPAIVDASEISWANVVPNQLAGLFVDSSITEPLLTGTLFGLVVASILMFIVDSTRAESADLRMRGLASEEIKIVGRQSSILKLLALAIGLGFGVGILAIGSLLDTSLSTSLTTVSATLLAIGGVLAVGAATAIFFEIRSV
jgi:hypothetical protein